MMTHAAWLLLGSTSRTTSEVWMVPATTPEARPRVVAPRKDGVEYEVRPRGDTFFLRSKLLPGVEPHVIHPRMSDDHFVMTVQVKDNSEVANAEAQLKSAGAIEIRH